MASSLDKFCYIMLRLLRPKAVGMLLLIVFSFTYLRYYQLLQSPKHPYPANLSFGEKFISSSIGITSTESEPTATATDESNAEAADTETRAANEQQEYITIPTDNDSTSPDTPADIQDNDSIIPETSAERRNRRPLIVFWAPPYHYIGWTFPRLANGDGGCDISFNRYYLDHADAVVFFMMSTTPFNLPSPEYRRKDQVYVWFSHESPWTVRYVHKHELIEYNNYFNWTMSYRTDADVMAAMWPVPAMDYLMSRVGRNEDMVDPDLESKVALSEEDFKVQVKALMTRKKYFAAWIVSDCDFTREAAHRFTLVNYMEKVGINVSKFGKCSGRLLPQNFTIVFEELSQYKFYLAFENSMHCQDYVTEKTIFNSFISGSVPIINGPSKKDVSKILPKGSYIHVEDFDNMENLIELLNFLDQNDAAYMQYFNWWRDPGAQTFPRFGFNYGPEYVPRNPIYPMYNESDVQEDSLEYERFGLYHLCRRLKRGDHKNQVHIVPDLAKEWYDREPPECTLDIEVKGIADVE